MKEVEKNLGKKCRKKISENFFSNKKNSRDQKGSGIVTFSPFLSMAGFFGDFSSLGKSEMFGKIFMKLKNKREKI